MQTFEHKGEFTLQFQRGTRKTKPHPRPQTKEKREGTKPHPQAQTKEKREGTKPHPQPLSKERGVICSPIVFYLLSISKAFYSPPSSGRDRGRGFLAPFIHVLFNSVPILPNFHKKAKASSRQVLSLIYFPRKICKFAAINPLTNEQRME